MSAEAVWAGWLLLFLVYEVTAALRERGTPQELTLSRTVWKWFDAAMERVALALFLAVLTAHLVLRWPGGLAVILAGLPVAVIIVKELVRRRPTAAAVLLVLPLLLGADRCAVSWPQPSPSPTVAPTPEPTSEPTPTTPTPTPVPIPTPPPPSACPKRLAAEAEVYLNAKPYGQGFDATVRVRGDLAFCQAIHGDAAMADCHLEGWATRVECEMELLGGCPIWQYRQPPDLTVHPARQVAPSDDGISADHFGDVVHRDDPITPAFEGQPAACGLQRDELGHPMAGFFTVAHGKGEVRACRPDGQGCSPWRAVDH